MTNTKIYADHAATTPIEKDVLEAMLPYLDSVYFNPSALYSEAIAVRAMIEKTRTDLLEFIGGDGRIIFTGSGTESVNMALRSAVSAFCGGRIIVSSVEHHAVLNTAYSLESDGITVTELPVDRYGSVSPDTLVKYMGNDVRLVSVMTVNNETGAVNDTTALCNIAHAGGALFHTDAVQALGILPLCAKDTGVDYLSVSAHKIYGPKGIGALYAAPSAPLTPLIRGGNQEGGTRAGTENSAGIAGFGAALTILARRQKTDSDHLAGLKKIFLEKLSKLPGLVVNSPSGGAPHIISVSARGIEAELCLLRLSMEGILASMGAACNASSIEPSHVVEAIGVPPEYKRGTLRFSFGRNTQKEEVIRTAETLAHILEKYRDP